MSQAILVSNNEVINSLYEVNLRAYVATNVTIKPSFSEAINLLEHSPNIDAIVCYLEEKNSEAELLKLFESLEAHKLNIPVIVLGIKKENTGKTFYIENRYEIKSLLQKMAKILEITAKDMAELAVPEFFPVPLNLFYNIDKASCDIYFRHEKAEFEYDHLKILEQNQDMKEKISEYEQQGVDRLYVQAKNRLHFINSASAAMVNELSRKDISAQERVEITQQAMSVLAEEVFESEEISQKMAELSRACIGSIKETIKDVPKLKKLLRLLLESKGDVCYKHSVISTYIATELLKVISWGSEEQANKIAFSLFFHDIYLVQVFKRYPDAIVEEDLLFRDDVDDNDKQIVLTHAKRAGALIKTFPKCPMGADMIITQHHGMTSGEGFATNFKDDISPLSKIMMISEEVAMYVLTQTKNSTEKFVIDKSQVISILEEKFRNHTYKKIIQAFIEINF